MRYKYKVGDVCVAYMDPTWTDPPERLRYHGEECTVVELLYNHHMMVNGEVEIVKRAYRVEFCEDELLVAKEHELLPLGEANWCREKIAKMLDFPLPAEMLR